MKSVASAIVVAVMACAVTATRAQEEVNDPVYKMIIKMIKEINGNIADLVKKVNKMDDKVENVGEKVDRMGEKVGKMDDKVGELKDKVDTVDGNIVDLNLKISEMQMNEQLLDLKIINVAEDVKNLQSNHTKDISEMRRTLADNTGKVITEIHKLSWFMFPVKFLGYGVPSSVDSDISQPGSVGECIHLCTEKRKWSGVEWNGFVWHLENEMCYCHQNEKGHVNSEPEYRKLVHFTFE